MLFLSSFTFIYNDIKIMQICNNVMTVAIPKNKFFIMISLAKSNDYIRINRVLYPYILSLFCRLERGVLIINE